MSAKEMKVSTRLALGFGSVLALLAIIMTVSLFTLFDLESDIENIVTDRFPKTVWSNNVIDQLNLQAQIMRNAVMYGEDRVNAQKELDRLPESRKITLESLEKLKETINIPEGKELLAKVWNVRDQYGPAQGKLIQFIQQGKSAEARNFILGDFQIIQNDYNAALQELIGFQVKLMTQTAHTAQKQTARSEIAVLFLGIISLLTGVVVAFVIARKLSRQLGGEPGDVAEAVRRIAAGDLDSTIIVHSDDTGSLAYSLREMQTSLRMIVSEMRVIVDAAANRGDFSVKMDLAGKTGFMKDLSELLNRLSNVTETGLKDVTRVTVALASGDLTQKIDQNYPGLFGQTRDGVNQTVQSLNEIVMEIRAIVEAAALQGDFSRKMELAGKVGYTRTLAELLNQLSNVTDNGLQDIRRIAQALAKGDLTQSVTQNYPGLFGQTTGAINATVENLQHLVGDIKNAVDLINTAAREIASGNQDLSARTEEQASSLEETASSMEELTGTVKQNADNARQANEFASQARSIATHGGEVVGQVVQTMSAIHQSSSKIADIISVIDGIAFQTNILALNAAVEAARAGEQGRGFAVVATEVRNLAQRSAAAAKEIKSLISDSVEKVDAGNRLVASAGQTMAEVVASIQRVAQTVTDISSASKEQSSGIEQVSQAVSQMDEVTQQNAALVEEAAAAAESLEEQANQLAAAVAVFRLAAQQEFLPGSHKRLSQPTHRSTGRKTPALPAKRDDEWSEF